jgi:hypothetical protein
MRIPLLSSVETAVKELSSLGRTRPSAAGAGLEPSACACGKAVSPAGPETPRIGCQTVCYNGVCKTCCPGAPCF